MKNILLAIIFMSFIGCGTVDCNKCPVVIKTKVLIPTIACYQPEPYEEFKDSLVSTEGITSEGKLFEVIAINVKMMERHIKLWEGYRACVDKILLTYNESLKPKEE